MARCGEDGWRLPESCAAIRWPVAGTIRSEERRQEKVRFKAPCLNRVVCFKFETVSQLCLNIKILNRNQGPSAGFCSSSC